MYHYHYTLRFFYTFVHLKSFSNVQHTHVPDPHGYCSRVHLHRMVGQKPRYEPSQKENERHG